MNLFPTKKNQQKNKKIYFLTKLSFEQIQLLSPRYLL